MELVPGWPKTGVGSCRLSAMAVDQEDEVLVEVGLWERWARRER